MPETSASAHITEIIYSDGEGIQHDVTIVPPGIDGVLGAVVEALYRTTTPVLGNALDVLAGNDEYQKIQEKLRLCSKYKPAKRRRLEYKAKIIRNKYILGALTSSLADFEFLSLSTEELEM